MASNNNSLLLAVVLFSALLSCKQQSKTEQQKYIVTDTGYNKIIYVLDSSITNFIQDSIMDKKLQTDVGHCMIRYSNNDNITEIVFYYVNSTRDTNKSYEVKNTNRFMKIKQDKFLPIIFETDWMYVKENNDDSNDGFNQHLHHPFNLKYAVLKFKRDKILEYDNLYRIELKAEGKIKYGK